MSKMGCPQSDTDPNTVTVLTKRGPVNKTLKSNSALNAALRTGTAVATEKKMMAGGNRQHTANKNTLRLDEETEELHHERVSLSLGKAMQQARQAKEWTQKDLSTAINEKPQVVAEYENGKAVPNQQILQKMERALGVKLRGKDIGQPLGSGKPHKK
ncbi:DNA-binding helix-turn-helix protein [Ancylostoma caninum]|uniref:DNA-binding helix-turn-helix protein n=1 Tax=Ancylostoma caninum TaxID=29170 RepID=A0A368GQ88_ANCCA|nr:DNA-binding helix-turn-helix protein [Ancylostoma caninum]